MRNEWNYIISILSHEREAEKKMIGAHFSNQTVREKSTKKWMCNENV